MSILICGHQLADAFAFVVDENLQVLYHPDPTRLGAVLDSSATAHAALRAGYAEVKGAHWAVVTQQPREDALHLLRNLMHDTLLKLLPVSLFGLLLILEVFTWVTRPLRQLANSAQHVPELGASRELHALNAWYSEAAAIRSALVGGYQPAGGNRHCRTHPHHNRCQPAGPGRGDDDFHRGSRPYVRRANVHRHSQVRG